MSDVMQVCKSQNSEKMKIYWQVTTIFMQVIEDYDYDKDGKLNMAEYNQYRSDSSEKSIKSIQSIDHENDNDNDLSESEEVVMVNLK